MTRKSSAAESLRGRMRQRAIAKMSAEELLEQMSPGQIAAFRAEAGIEAPVTTTGPMARIKAVYHAIQNDPALAGRAHDAIQMLVNDDLASIPASGLVKLLKSSAGAFEKSLLDEAAAMGRAEMREAMAQSQGLSVEEWHAKFGNGAETAHAASPSDLWDRAWASVNGTQHSAQPDSTQKGQ